MPDTAGAVTDKTACSVALEKLVEVLRLQHPNTSYAWLTCDGVPYAHVGDGDQVDFNFDVLPDMAERLLRVAKLWAHGYQLMATSAFVILGG